MPAIAANVNLVSMTTNTTSPRQPPGQVATALPDRWLLQDAKARFSELVRRVRSEGPQHVTVHGREAVVVVAAEEFRRMQGAQTGKALVDALRASPHPEIDLGAAASTRAPVRDVAL